MTGVCKDDAEYKYPSLDPTKFNSGSDAYDAGGLNNIIQSGLKGLNSIFPNLNENSAFTLNKEDLLDFSDLDALEIVTENKGPIAFAVVAFVLAVVVTITGIVWCAVRCCCRDKCCNKNRSRNKNRQNSNPPQYYSQYSQFNRDESRIPRRKAHKIKRYTYGALFICMAAISFALVISCLAANGQMKTGIDGLAKHVDIALADINTYLDTTKQQISTLLVGNYGTLSKRLNKIIEDNIPDLPGSYSSEKQFQTETNLKTEVDTFNNDRKTISQVTTNLNNVKNQIAQLDSELKSFNKDFAKLLKQCKDPGCNLLRNSPQNSIPLVETIFPDNLRLDTASDWNVELSKVIDDTNKYLKKRNAIRAVAPHATKEDLQVTINVTQTELQKVSAALGDAIDVVKDAIEDVRDDVQDTQYTVDDFSPYVYNSMILICVAILCTIVVMTLGVIMIMLDSKGDNSSRLYSDKTGSSLINCGMFTVFLTYALFIVIMLVYFAIAGLGGQIICEAIDAVEGDGTLDPKCSNTFFKESFFKGHTKTTSVKNLTRVHPRQDPPPSQYETPSFTCIINKCKNNLTAYNAFQLKSVYDTEELISLEDKFYSLSGRRSRMQVVDSWYKLADNKNSFVNTADISKKMEKPIVSSDLSELSKKVEDVGKAFTDENQSLKPKFIEMSKRLSKLHAEFVEPLQKQMKKTTEQLHPLSSSKFSSVDLSVRMKNIARTLSEILDTPEDKAVADIVLEVDKFGNCTHDLINDEVGICGVLYDAYTYSKAGFCVDLVYPVGGFWVGLSVVLALTIPMLIVAALMNRLVQHDTKPKGYQKVLFCM